MSLKKKVLKPLAKCVLVPLGITKTESETDTAIQKKLFWIRYDNINTFEWNNGWYYEND